MQGNEEKITKKGFLMRFFSAAAGNFSFQIDTILPYYNINRLNLRNLNYHSAGYSGGLSGPWHDWLASMQVLFTPVS